MRLKFLRLLNYALVAIVLSLSSSVYAQNDVLRTNEGQVRTILHRLETRTDTFRREVDEAFDASRADDTRYENEIMAFINNFEQATDRLHRNFDAGRSSVADAQEVLNRAVFINNFMRSNRVSVAAQNQWNLIRSDLSQMANFYRISNWNWNNVPTTNTGGTVVGGLPRASEARVRMILSRLETRTDTFRQRVDAAFDNSRADGSRLENEVMEFIDEFEEATDRLHRNFEANRSSIADAQEVLNRAVFINNFMRSNRVSVAAQNQWNLIRSDLNMLASLYQVNNWTWNTIPTTTVGTRPYTVTDMQLNNLLVRIDQRSDIFQRNLERANLRRNVNVDDDVMRYVSDFDTAAERLRSNVKNSMTTTADVEDLLSRAALIDRYMRNNRLTVAAERQWNLLRSDLTTLANYYSVSWNWSNPRYPSDMDDNRFPSDQTAGFDSRLTGTYRLNTRQSDNVSAVVERATSNIWNANQRTQVRQTLERRLMAPETLVIEKRGQQVTIASTMSQAISFEADGVTRTETSPNGRTVRVRVNSVGNGLTIDYEGDRVNDFHVNFVPMNNGQLRVMRRVYLDDRNETVTVTSVYDKIDQVARFDDRMPNTGGSNTGSNVAGGFIVPNNTQIVARLDSQITTQTARDGDRFTMTVVSPSQYNGAVIEGRVVGEKSGVVSGRATLSLNFDTIRLRNGSTYRFAGIVDQVREPDGDLVSVNNEGAVRDRNQTTKTITRAGIGAALGAIIGAIAGGGEGAAIGAAIGAGAGAGTVVLEGRDNLQLDSGTEFTITATAPNNSQGFYR